ncbi:MAG: CHRD domain-containing protein [Candidatus Nitrosocosmicus sp.]|nr:CHRD domain-containing protein [Candidatus Nitrosocosmicus sp.]MDN5866374.1 CHRD domain-containing protein [Candidatus Nitrosocosmicus sp.]
MIGGKSVTKDKKDKAMIIGIIVNNHILFFLTVYYYKMLIYTGGIDNLMKLNTIFLLITTGALFTALLMMSNPTANIPQYTNAQSDSNIRFTANLTNYEVFPSRNQPNTDGTGNATFTLLPDGDTMSYVITGSNIGEVNASSSSIIRNIALGYSTDRVPFSPMYNFHLATNEGLIKDGVGTIQGNFTSADFLERYRDIPMSDLVRSILDGNVFVKISTVDHPLGEIGGMLRPAF